MPADPGYLRKLRRIFRCLLTRRRDSFVKKVCRHLSERILQVKRTLVLTLNISFGGVLQGRSFCHRACWARSFCVTSPTSSGQTLRAASASVSRVASFLPKPITQVGPG